LCGETTYFFNHVMSLSRRFSSGVSFYC